MFGLILSAEEIGQTKSSQKKQVRNNHLTKVIGQSKSFHKINRSI